MNDPHAKKRHDAAEARTIEAMRRRGCTLERHQRSGHSEARYLRFRCADAELVDVRIADHDSNKRLVAEVGHDAPDIDVRVGPGRRAPQVAREVVLAVARLFDERAVREVEMTEWERQSAYYKSPAGRLEIARAHKESTLRDIPELERRIAKAEARQAAWTDPQRQRDIDSLRRQIEDKRRQIESLTNEIENLTKLAG